MFESYSVFGATRDTVEQSSLHLWIQRGNILLTFKVMTFVFYYIGIAYLVIQL